MLSFKNYTQGGGRMDKQRFDQALARNGLFPLSKAIGRKFVLEYKEPDSGDRGVIAGTITAVCLNEGDEEDLLTLYISVPTLAATREPIECLLGGPSGWQVITTRGGKPPVGKLQLL